MKSEKPQAAAERTGKGKLAENSAWATRIALGLLWDAALGGLTKGASAATSLNKAGKTMKVLDSADDVFETSYKKYGENHMNTGLKSSLKSGNINERIANGELSTQILKGQQRKHIVGTKEYYDKYKSGRNPQSILTIDIDQAQKLIDRYSGKGIPGKKDVNGVWTEFVTTDTVVGKYYKNGNYYITNRMAIHYSKKGAHIFPVEPKGGK